MSERVLARHRPHQVRRSRCLRRPRSRAHRARRLGVPDHPRRSDPAGGPAACEARRLRLSDARAPSSGDRRASLTRRCSAVLEEEVELHRRGAVDGDEPADVRRLHVEVTPRERDRSDHLDLAIPESRACTGIVTVFVVPWMVSAPMQRHLNLGAGGRVCRAAAPATRARTSRAETAHSRGRVSGYGCRASTDHWSAIARSTVNDAALTVSAVPAAGDGRVPGDLRRSPHGVARRREKRELLANAISGHRLGRDGPRAGNLGCGQRRRLPRWLPGTSVPAAPALSG